MVDPEWNMHMHASFRCLGFEKCCHQISLTGGQPGCWEVAHPIGWSTLGRSLFSSLFLMANWRGPGLILCFHFARNTVGPLKDPRSEVLHHGSREDRHTYSNPLAVVSILTTWPLRKVVSWLQQRPVREQSWTWHELWQELCCKLLPRSSGTSELARRSSSSCSKFSTIIHWCELVRASRSIQSKHPCCVRQLLQKVSVGM